MRFRRRDKDTSVGGDQAGQEQTPAEPEGPPSYGAAAAEVPEIVIEPQVSDVTPDAGEQVLEGSESEPEVATAALAVVAAEPEPAVAPDPGSTADPVVVEPPPEQVVVEPTAAAVEVASVSEPAAAAAETRMAEAVVDVTPDPVVVESLPEPEPEPESIPEPEPEPTRLETTAVPREEPVDEPPPARASRSNRAEREPQVSGSLRDIPQSNGSLSTPRPLPRVIAIANQKGGVGKTTTTVNLGAALSELSYRVLVIDLDPQGNATSGLGIDTRNFESSMYDVVMRDAPIEDCIEPTNVQNLFLTPATIDLAGVEIELVSAFSRELKLKKAIDSVVDDFDFVLIDCPPSLGLLTVNGLAAATEVLVPIQCEYYALEGLSQLLRNVALVASNLNEGLEVSTIVLTMYDSRTRLAVDVADEVREHFKDRVCKSIIPRTVRLSEAPSFGQPITVFDPTSRGAVAYRELAKEVSNGAPKRSG